MKARFTWLVALLFCWLTCSPVYALGRLNAEAQKHFDAGLAYADDPSGPKWEEAMKEFLAAYAIHPTWELKNNIGLCALHLERDGEAIEAYTEYLDHGGEKGLSDKHRKLIERDIATLSASLVRVAMDVEPAEAAIVDERRNSKGELRVNRYPVQGGKASLGLHPGTHRITVEAQGFVSDSWTFDAEPASTHQHRFKLEPEKKPETVPPEPVKVEPIVEPPKPVAVAPSTPTGVYIGLAATGVFAAAATVTGVVALGKNKDYVESSSLDERDRLKKSGETMVLLTNIAVGAAVVSAGVTAYLYLTAPKTTPVKTGNAYVHFVPVASPNAAGLAISGKF